MSSNTFRPQPGVWYSLEFRALPGKTPVNARVRVPGQSQADSIALEAADVSINTTVGVAAQWSFEEVEPGWFIITNRNSGMVLDVRWASVDSGAVIQQHVRHAPDSPHRFAQYFSVNLVDKNISPFIDRYVIRSRVSQKVFMYDSAAVVQESYDAEAFVFLAINPVGVDTFAPDPNVYYRIRSLHTGRVFDNSSGFQAGAVLSAEKESPNLLLSQQYRFEEVEPGWYLLHVRHSDLVLSVTAGSSADGADMQQWTRNGGKNQQWKIQRRDDGFLLINRNSGKAITWIPGGAGNYIKQYPDSPADANRQQTWRFEAVEAQPFLPQPGAYYTLKFAHSDLAVAVEGGKSDENAAVVQLGAAGQPYTQWRFEEVKDLKGFYQVVARHSGKVLSLPSDTLTEGTRLVQQKSDSALIRQHWALDASPAGLVLVNRFSGRVLDVVDDSTDAGAAVQQTTRLRVGNLAVAATVDATADFKPRSDAWYVLRFAHSGKILTVSLGSSANGATVWQAFDNGGTHQHWRFTEVEPGWYVLTARHSGKALDLFNGSTSDGAKVQQWTRNDGNQNQHWALVATPYGWALRARKSGKPIEVPNDSQAHGTLIAQGSPQWDQNQSLNFEVFVSDATLATPVVRYTAPSLPASAVGVDSGTATGGTATGVPTTSTTVPDAVSANSPLSTSILFAPYDLALSFTGDITSQALSAGQRFVGPAHLPAPFNTAVDSLNLLVSTDPVGASLTFSLPSSCSLKSVIENEISGKISDATLRGIVDNTLKPFAALLPTPTVILSTIEGEDETYGSYLAGFNAFAGLPLSDIPPFNVLHSLFPSAGLASRSLTLGIGTNAATSPSEREFWVSGNAWLDIPLIPSFLTLKELSLSLNKASTSVNTAGGIPAIAQNHGIGPQYRVRPRGFLRTDC